MSAITGFSRREFLAKTAAAGAGLVLGFVLPQGGRRAMAEPPQPPSPTPDPNAFLRISPDGAVTVFLKHVEMGQGVATSLPMVVAEELDCDWKSVRWEHAPAAMAYAHTAFGMQMTGGSTSTWESFEQLRMAGAAAREMLVAAAAKEWGVAEADCRAENGEVICKDKRLSYGHLATAAAALPVPEKPALKDAKNWKIIGKPAKRLDSPDKVAGKARFGLDVRVDGMQFAAIARPPVFGAKVKSFKAEKAKAVDGVRSVIQISTGIAVLADNTWSARRGVAALEIDWDLGKGAGHSTEKQREEYRALAKTAGAVATRKGDAVAALAKAAKVIEAEYELPYLAHAMMEPLNCTVKIADDGCDVWTGTQMQTMDQMAAARAAGVKPAQVRLHTTLMGGGFGRRANPVSDFVTEAVEVAKASGKTVQVSWTREDDIRGGYYRPMWHSRMRASLDGAGKIAAWAHTLVGQSIMAGTPFAMMIKDGVDTTSVEGASTSPYLDSIPDSLVDLHSPPSPVPVLWWRSVGHTHTGFVVESFIDELSAAAGKDPVEFRRGLLAGHARHLGVLNLAASKFGWDTQKPAAGRGRGIAVHESFGSFVAHAVEVSIEGANIRVHRVVSAIDCGPVVNPAGVEAQVQSAIVYGLSAALFGEITVADGRVEQSNFHDYRILRNQEMPAVEVHIVPSTDKMGGVGEPGVPPIAPAVANAVAALTGQRLRKLPFRIEVK